MTPFKGDRAITPPFDAAMEEASVVSSPPSCRFSRPFQKSAPPSVGRLFFPEDDEDEHHNNGVTTQNPDRKLILKPLDVNVSFAEAGTETSKLQRKRLAEEPAGRDHESLEMCDDMSFFQSPGGVSPSAYRTIDGRLVLSKNPFSPMHVDNVISTADVQKSNAPCVPDSFASPERKTPNDVPKVPLMRRQPTPQRQWVPPSVVKDHRNSTPTRPGPMPRLHFRGSINEDAMDADIANTYSAHKVRRLNMDDDVVAASSAQQPSYKHRYPSLAVSTYGCNPMFSIDETSPTDIMSFPTPPTPTKPKPTLRMSGYSPSMSRTLPPQTPVAGRRVTLHHDGSDDEDDDEESSTAPKSRFRSDFDVLDELGRGCFGTVYKVLSRLDGCMYAIKEAQRKARGIADRDRMLKEVYALAVLSGQADIATLHIVRYHQAWMEDNRLYIQTELCTSTLGDEVSGSSFPITEERRYKLLREMLLALEFIHRNSMVHLDIKPDNIFVKNDQYKLGDFGLVSKISYEKNDVEEGDSRYMSKELLAGDHKCLTKSDIFSLGATIYEVSLGRPLPTSGQEWQDIRAGKLLPLPFTPPEMATIIRQMVEPSVEDRPDARELLRREQLLSDDQKALMAERNKVFQASRELAAQQRMWLQFPKAPPRRSLVRRNTWSGGYMST